MKILTLGLLVFWIGACTKKESAVQGGSTPEQTVKSFVELSAHAKDKADKGKIQALCVGELRRAFDRMSEELFQMSYLGNNVTIEDLKILDSKIEGETAKVQYQLSLENKQGTDTTKEVNSREVELLRTDGTWQIESIRIIGSDKLAFTRGMIF